MPLVCLCFWLLLRDCGLCLCLCVDYARVCVYSERWYEVSTRGQWKGPTAGGCRNHKTWSGNPQYLLTPDGEQTTRMLIVLAQDATRSPLEAIGFYAITRTGQVAGKAAFMRAPEVRLCLRVVCVCVFLLTHLGAGVLRARGGPIVGPLFDRALHFQPRLRNHVHAHRLLKHHRLAAAFYRCGLSIKAELTTTLTHTRTRALHVYL